MVKGGQEFLVAVVAGDAKGRLDAVLASHCAGLSRARLQGLIRSGHVTTGGATISEPSYRVKPGQTFAIFVPDSTPAIPQGEPIPLAVVHEDPYLIVIDKPAGLVVHPAPGNPDRTLVNALIAHCGESLSGIGGVRRPGIVHRLDKDTSGLMVAAKTDAAHLGLAAQFEARSIERAYTAVVWGAPPAAKGEISGNIGRSPRNRKKMAVVARGGKPAITGYRVTARYGQPADPVACRLECRLKTGRTHQIRVHLAHIGAPVIGDPLYGGRPRQKGGRQAGRPKIADVAAAAAALDRQALHAHLIGFEHPVSGERLRFTSELPMDINALLVSLEEI